MSDEYEFDLGWHSLNYRTAGINEAHRCWLELEACVNRIVEREVTAATGFISLVVQSREAEEARFYRYLRDEAGQLPDDHDGPMICSGLGDNFDYLRGEECDAEIRAAIEKARG